MDRLGDWLGGLPPVLVFVVVAALVTAEAAIVAGMVLPSATALIAMGLLANAGVVPVLPAFLVAVGAALLGGTVAYRRASSAPPGRHLARAEKLFARYGGRAIFIGQWIVGARTLMPRLAARHGVPYRRFVLWHAPAATLWALWMVGTSYLAGAGYDVLAARAGRAAGALAALTLIVVGLVLVGRFLGQHPFPVRTPSRTPVRLLDRGRPPIAAAALSLGLLTLLAVLIVEVIPPVVRFSGLAAADPSIAEWARGQWTSDGYLFALRTATTVLPDVLITFAVPVAVLRWWWSRRPRGAAGPGASRPGLFPGGLFEALGPVLPALVFAGALSLVSTPGWRAADRIVLPGPADFDGPLPMDAAASALAGMSAGATAQVAAAAGLLAWLLTHGLRWKWRVAVWTGAGVLVATCAGSWVYLGWSRTSETVAAIALGVAWAALNAAIWAARSRRPLPPPPPGAPARELAGAAA
ncbi:DedA family protein [Actinoplanes sp. NPDC020271]|uniref:DedA family protein n=1 Tax=Actinoplanes sp. NPDC020271 TaxID=3363896 RepID=UPI0037927AE4